ncbi:MAG: hypothetical protein GY930_20935 [bacterium]|nr:hypothetical protein [bacterium]
MTDYATTMGWFPDLNHAIAIQLNMDGDRMIDKPLPVLMIEFATIALTELGKTDPPATGPKD